MVYSYSAVHDVVPWGVHCAGVREALPNELLANSQTKTKELKEKCIWQCHFFKWKFDIFFWASPNVCAGEKKRVVDNTRHGAILFYFFTKMFSKNVHKIDHLTEIPQNAPHGLHPSNDKLLAFIDNTQHQRRLKKRSVKTSGRGPACPRCSS